ncbi:hypothetical protein DQE84_17300, partial [Staphylococcus warneri]
LGEERRLLGRLPGPGASREDAPRRGRHRDPLPQRPGPPDQPRADPGHDRLTLTAARRAGGSRPSDRGSR